MGKTFHIECFRCEVNALVFCHFLVYMQLVSRYKTSRIEVKKFFGSSGIRTHDRLSYEALLEAGYM